MIEAEDLSKYFGSICALHGVSLQVGQGETVGLLGPNGSGKTTLMRILTGYFPPTSGVVRIAGFDVARQSIEVRRQVGYLPESAVLYPEMRVRGFLRFSGSARGLAGRVLSDRIDAVLHDFGLVAHADRFIRTLSKGFRQRVGLAQALLHQPEVLVLDEPTVGLDPRQVIEMRQVIASLKGKTTILLSTHILAEIDISCDRVVILDRGRVVAQDTPTGLTAKASDDECLLLRVLGTTPLEPLLRSLEGVEVLDVRRADDVQEVIVRLGAGLPLRQQLAKLLVDEGYGLLEMRPLTRTLEELFVRLVGTEH